MTSQLTYSASSASPDLTPVDAEVLRDFWYPALLSTKVRKNKLVAAHVAGLPLVIGRTAMGQTFTLYDSCPHRGIPLSFGRLDRNQVECCYHGWRFDPHTGQCCAIPSLTADSKLKIDRIFASSFPCGEQDGYVWVFVPDPSVHRDSLPPIPKLPVFSPRYRLTHLMAELPCNIDHGIIGLMDPAHGPFVHQAWWWRSRHSIHLKEKTFEPIPNGFRMRAHAPSTNSLPYKLLRIYGHTITSTIDFVLPNLRLEEIHCGPYWFSSRAVVTPTKTNQCRIDFCAAWNIFPYLPFVVPIFRLFARAFLRQDQQTMIKQSVGLKNNPPLMLIDDADRPAKWYFQLKAAYREAQRTSHPMKHPIPAPITLRWRS